MLSLRNRIVSRTVVTLSVIMLLAQGAPALAVNLNWDPTNSNSIFFGGAGTWDVSTTSNWYDGTTDIQWTDTTGTADTAIFGGDQGGTVTIGSNPLGALGVQFSTPGYTIAGTSLSVGASAIAVNNVVQGTSTINAPVTISSAQSWNVAGASTLVVNGAITGSNTISKAGNGILTINGNNTGLTGGVTLGSGGQINLGNANALGTTASIFNLGGTGSFDNTSGAAMTLAGNHPVTIGNATITYIGSNDLDLGTGGLTSSASRSLIVKASNLTIGGVFSLQASGRNLTKQGAGTLTLLSNTNAYDQTIIQGGLVDVSTTGQLGSGFPAGTGPQSLQLGNGGFKIAGTSAGNRSQAVGSLSFGITNGGGLSSLTLAADPATNTAVTAASLGTTRSVYATMLFRGTNLGTTSIASASAGTSNIAITTAPTSSTAVASATVYAAIGSGANNTTEAAVFHGGLYAGNSAGNGSTFATYDTANGVRGLNGSEQATSYPGASSNDNILLNLAGATAITGVTTNTLQIHNVSGASQTVTNSGTTLNPVNGLLFTGSDPVVLTGGTLNFAPGGSGTDGVLLSTNTGGVTISTALTNASTGGERGWTIGGSGDITVDANIAGQGGNGALSINGPGTVTVNGTVTTSSKGIIVHGGTLKLGSSFTMTGPRLWQVGSGATLDMNGLSVNNVEALSETNIAGSSNNAAGTITNSAGGSPVTLTLNKGSNLTTARTSAAVLTGNLNLAISNIAGATGTTTLVGQSTYTGTTTISSGPVIMGAHNVFPVATAFTIDGGGVVPATLNMAGFSQTVGSLSGSSAATPGNISNSTGSSTLTVNGSSVTTFSGVLASGGGTLNFVKEGSGTQTLAGANTYTGITVVNSGTLVVTGTHSGAGAYTVNPGGTLSGTGTITTAASIPLTFLGTLSPGLSPGTLMVNANVAFYPSATLAYDLQGNDPTISANNDLLKGVQNLTLDGTLNVTDVTNTFTSANPGDKWTLITYNPASTFVNNGLNIGTMPALSAGNAYAIDTGTAGSVFLTIVAVPEASSFLAVGIVALGCAGVTSIRKRRAI